MMMRRTIFVALSACTIFVGCASRESQVSSAETTAARVRTRPYRESERSAQALSDQRYHDALAHADRAVRVRPDNPWAYYERAVALSQVGRVDEAVTAFRTAEARFEGGDRRGKAIAIYGRARVLSDVGRCDEATEAFTEYADFVRGTDAHAAEMARTYAAACDVPNGAELERRRADGWRDYDRAVALAERGHDDEAAAAYDAAARAFASVDPHAASIAIYGRAHWFDMAGRCVAAGRAYREYADLVRATQPQDADMAERLARECTSR